MVNFQKRGASREHVDNDSILLQYSDDIVYYNFGVETEKRPFSDVDRSFHGVLKTTMLINYQLNFSPIFRAYCTVVRIAI